MLGSSRAFSIPCPRRLLHLEFHRLWHRDELVYQITMRHRSKSFASNVIFVFARVEKIPLVALWIHEIPLYNHTLFWNSSRMQSLVSQPPSRC